VQETNNIYANQMSEDVNSEDEVEPLYSGVSGCPVVSVSAVK